MTQFHSHSSYEQGEIPGNTFSESKSLFCVIVIFENSVHGSEHWTQDIRYPGHQVLLSVGYRPSPGTCIFNLFDIAKLLRNDITLLFITKSWGRWALNYIKETQYSTQIYNSYVLVTTWTEVKAETSTIVPQLLRDWGRKIPRLMSSWLMDRSQPGSCSEFQVCLNYTTDFASRNPSPTKMTSSSCALSIYVLIVCIALINKN